jgi:hypothetical protein
MMAVQKDGQTDGQMDRWTDGQMDRPIKTLNRRPPGMEGEEQKSVAKKEICLN